MNLIVITILDILMSPTPTINTGDDNDGCCCECSMNNTTQPEALKMLSFDTWTKIVREKSQFMFNKLADVPLKTICSIACANPRVLSFS